MSTANSPKHWKNVQLNEIASLRRENIKPEDALYSSYVGLEHIDSGESQLKRWGDAAEVKSAKSRFYPDDVLYGKLRAYLDKAVIAEMEGICSTDILVVTANSKILPRFLVYLLHTHPLVSHAVATSTGVNHPRTSWNALGKFTFELPPLPEQRAIAHVLGAIQAAKAARQRELTLERECKVALMDHLFSYGMKGEPRKQTEIGEIPESWTIYPFEDCLKKIKSKKISSVLQKNYQEAGEFPVVDQGAKFISGWTDSVECVIFDNLPVVIFGDHTRIFKYIDFPFAVGAEGTKLVYANDDFFDARFFYYALLNLKIPDKGYNRHYRYLREFSIAVPPLPEQCVIAEILQACDTKIAALEQEIESLNELFHAMLDELMTGKRSAAPLIEAELPD